ALQITGERLEYGSVQVGSTVSKSFTVTNTGGTQVALTKSKPPTGGAFTATTSLPEGTTLAPGQSVTESVSFTPSAPGYAGAVWPINGTDSTGLHEVTFTGSGTVPAPGSAWTVNGTAALVTGGVRLTSATSQQAGSAFFSQPIESRHIVLEYDQTINGGGGADGMAVAFADASSTGPDAVGAAGGGLGFSGIPGIAVAFDTYEGTGAPSNNFVGITDGPTGSAKDVLHWLTTATVASSLRSAVRKVKIEVLSGTITVWIDGTQVLSGTAALPSKVYLGFTGGTGAITDIHQATDVVLGGDTAPVEPPPANLKIQSTVNAPADSSQASQQFTFTGTCPSSFTTVPIGNGTLSPSLTGAVAGAVCSVAENAPGAGWSTEAIINGGKEEVPLTESGGKIIAPSFALAGGPNTIQFINTYTAPPSLVPDPTAGGWTMNKSASLTADELLLTPAAKNKKGDAFWPEAIDPRMLTVEFDATIGGGTGADGLTLLFADVTRSETKKIGATGEGLGVGGLPGVAIALVEASDASAGASNFAGISDGVSGNKKTLQWLATANLALPLQNTTTHVKVVNSAGNTTVSLDGTQVLSRALALPSSAYLAFTAATGKQTDRHAIAHLFVSSP
ncbi:MAG TPA: DUF5979 domain-containing protein, partial [Solirubrobacteraceae bacterium]|nr:DUF5979 domain-containing protein [Solirubrobacteraceae bacterium]